MLKGNYLKNKKRNVKRGGVGNEMPVRQEGQTSAEFFAAIQKFRREQANRMTEGISSTTVNIPELEFCKNKHSNNSNEIGEISEGEYIFKFKTFWRYILHAMVKSLVFI